MTDLVIKSERIITPSGIVPGYLMINSGKITGIDNTAPSGAKKYVDAGKNILMPGIIDPHVHINEPGRTDWEGFQSATLSAIAGGITTLIDMPLNSSPVTTTANAFQEKLKATTNKLHCNVGFWGGVIPGNELHISDLIHSGVKGFKAFLTHSGIDEFPNAEEKDLRKVMPSIAEAGLPLLVHCELTDHHSNNSDPRVYENYLHSRPSYWETNAIKLIIRLSAEYNCRIHIVHTSSAESVSLIRAAKEDGLLVTAETAQHYLFFAAETIADGQTQFKCAPPIRERGNNEKLYEALQEGVIDFVATDHSPAPASMKELESGNFLKAWGGISSLQLALPALWTVCLRHGSSVEMLCEWLCAQPAKLTGLSNSKGKLQVGYDADLVIWDDQQTFKVTPELLRHKHKISPYIYEQLTGLVEQTYIAGELVFEGNNIVKKEQGKILLHHD